MNPRIVFVHSAWRAAWLALSILCCAAPAQAERLLLWGIQDGCELNPDLTRQVERQFHQAGLDVHPLGPPGSSCAGSDCAERLRVQCPQARGRVVGGRVYRNKSFLKLRLWMHDLDTQKTAYQDGWCQDCSLSTLLATHARALMEQPQWGPAPSATPMYCANASAPQAGTRRSGPLPRVHLTVYGDPKNRAAVVALLKQHMEAAIYPVQVLHREKDYGLSDLQRIVGGSKKDGQVLGVELRKEGSFTLWLYDGLTEKTKQEEIECLGCDLERLTQVLKTNVDSLLAYCFDGDCRSGTEEKLPPEACAPLPETAQCKGDALLGGTTEAAAGSGRHIDPTTARLVKGLTWGVFAATSVTTLALLIANEAGSMDINGRPYDSSLSRPFWLGLGLSGLTLAAAIPTTLVINKASSSASQARGQAGSSPTSSSTIRCPN
jgi:hypothetical protein